MSDILRRLAKQLGDPAPFTPAGYLPAPKPARFISEAEEAAKRLPPSIKAQSLKNALIKGGAKPVELEYAGVDDFIARHGGGKVNSPDVLKFLQEQGPLGRLKRVEQQVEGDAVGSWFDEESGEMIETGREGARPPVYAPNVRQPFDASTASNQTKYQQYTVPGKKGDFTGYREVLIEDPKNRPDGKPLVGPQRSPLSDFPDADEWRERATNRLRQLESGDFADIEAAARESDEIVEQAANRGLEVVRDEDGLATFEFTSAREAVNAHDSDYWARYNEYPDRIAVQNIQSDAGQDFSKGDGGDAASLNRRLDEVRGWRARLIAELNDSPSLTPGQRDEIEDQIGSLNEEEAEIFGTGGNRFARVYTQDGEERFSESVAHSPLARDDNWKNLMARHIALQSIAGGGKPITIPTGRQMVDAEGFGMGTHSNPADAAKAATAYNADLVRRLQKIFRGLDPSGADVVEQATVEPTLSSGWSDAERQRTSLRRESANSLEDVLVARGREGLDPSRLRDGDLMAQEILMRAEQAHERSPTPETWAALQKASTLAQEAWQARQMFDNSSQAKKTGLQKASQADQKIYHVLRDRRSPAARTSLEILLHRGDPSPEFRDAAMRVIQYDRLLGEMGRPGGMPNAAMPEVEPQPQPQADAPGWTITPSPEAVRAALEKGLPIMSLAPLLLSPATSPADTDRR